jgi:hypothetical protein
MKNVLVAFQNSMAVLFLTAHYIVYMFFFFFAGLPQHLVVGVPALSPTMVKA